MEEERIYCIDCDEEVNYITRKETTKVVVKGREFEATLTRAYCAKCGAPVSPDKIAKANDLIVFDEYRRLEGLLTSEEIKAIRKKRHLSQVEFARLINCGEKNIARYETGTVQDRAFDLLMRLADDDQSYAVLCALSDIKAVRRQPVRFVWVVDCSTQTSIDVNRILDRNKGCEFEFRRGGVLNGNRTTTKEVLRNGLPA